MYSAGYKGTASIVLEDYMQMEGLMKQFILVGPTVAAAVYASGDLAAYKKFRDLYEKVVDHMDS